MAGVPIAVEILAIHRQSSFLEFKIYNLDKTNQTIHADINQLEKHVSQIKEVRSLGYDLSDFIALQQDLQRQIEEVDLKLQSQRQLLPDFEEQAQRKLEIAKTDSAIPDYDKRLAQTVTSKEKRGGIIAGFVVASLGIMVFFSGEGSLNKWMGGILFLGGGLSVAGVYSTEVDDSEEARKQRELQQNAERIKSLISETERKANQEIESYRNNLKNLERDQGTIQRQLSEIEAKIQLAELVQPLNEALNDGIIFGEENVLQEMQLWITQRQADGSVKTAGLAGAALVGLMVAGAFMGVSF